MVNANRKGKGYERHIANKINKFLDTNVRRTPQSGGMSFKGDLIDTQHTIIHGYHVECKNQKTIKFREWFIQANGDCPSNKIPIIVFNVKGTDMVALKFDDWLGDVKLLYMSNK